MRLTSVLEGDFLQSQHFFTPSQGKCNAFDIAYQTMKRVRVQDMQDIQFQSVVYFNPVDIFYYSKPSSSHQAILEDIFTMIHGCNMEG